MRNCAAFALVLAALAANLAAADEPVRASPSAYVPVPRERYVLPVPCTVTLSPDVAMIVGGYSARGLKAVEASERLDRIGEALQRRVAELGGKWVPKDRLRGAKTVTLRDTKQEQPPYVAVQVVEIELPLGSDVDRALDALIALGLDRFGRRVGLEPATDTQPVVYYRVSSLQPLVQSGFEPCKRDAVALACTWPDQPICKAPASAAARCLQVDSVSLSTEVNDGRYRETLSIQHPQRNVKPIEGAGKGPFVFTGTANVSYATSCIQRESPQ